MKIAGELKFPGDKSISHRALMLAALTSGKCVIDNISTAEDVESTKQCLVACGIDADRNENELRIMGGTLKSPGHPLNCGNSGTTARLLTGLLAGQGMEATLTGDRSLTHRPFGRIIRPLERMGASIESDHGHLPLHLKANSTSRGITYTTPVASAQVKSSILLAGLGAQGKTTVIEKIRTRNHTEIMLKTLGAKIQINEEHITVSSLQAPLKPFQMTVPGDSSTAAFFSAAAALMAASELILNGVLMNPTRDGFTRALKRMGAGVDILDRYEIQGEQVGNLKITSRPLKGISISGAEIPRVIDELPILAVVATQAEGTTSVRDAGELRVKESDRINAICTNLSRMGADVTELEDGFVIIGPTALRGVPITTYGDHRVAMAFTIAGLMAEGHVELDNPLCIRSSCPEFEDFLKKVMR